MTRETSARQSWPIAYTCVAAPCAPLWFASRYAEAELAFRLDIGPAIQDGVDYPAEIAVSVAPSGTGEMQVAAVSAIGSEITILPTGGQPGRIYTYNIVVTMSDGNIYPFVVRQGVAKLLSTDTAQVAPDPGFGAEVTWMAGSNNVSSQSVGANLVLSAVPCSVANVQANTTTAGGYLMLFDSATVPADGAVTWARCWQVNAGSTLPPQSFAPPLSMARGAVLAFSSNADQFTLTSSPTATFAGQVQ